MYIEAPALAAYHSEDNEGDKGRDEEVDSHVASPDAGHPDGKGAFLCPDSLQLPQDRIFPACTQTEYVNHTNQMH